MHSVGLMNSGAAQRVYDSKSEHIPQTHDSHNSEPLQKVWLGRAAIQVHLIYIWACHRFWHATGSQLQYMLQLCLLRIQIIMILCMDIRIVSLHGNLFLIWDSVTHELANTHAVQCYGPDYFTLWIKVHMPLYSGVKGETRLATPAETNSHKIQGLVNRSVLNINLWLWKSCASPNKKNIQRMIKRFCAIFVRKSNCVMGTILEVLVVLQYKLQVLVQGNFSILLGLYISVGWLASTYWNVQIELAPKV